METSFVHEDDLLKHYVRYKGWLPACKLRRKAVLAKHVEGRRLRYFTFCASGAVDVLMLDVAKIVSPGSAGRFDNVVFFERNADFIPDIQKRVPGSIGFPGEFTSVVLLNDPHEEELIEGVEALESPDAQDDTAATRERMRRLAQRRDFITQFPFDIINLDLQDFFFKAQDPLPGSLVGCMRKLFTWQQRAATLASGRVQLDGFTLMFTTQIGPTNMTAEYRNMLVNCVTSNLQKFPELSSILAQRLGDQPWIDCHTRDFATFFRIAAPKIVASILHETDWYVAGENGVEVYEFERPSDTGPYRMLHLIMDVKRKNPPISARGPGIDDDEGIAAYRAAAGKIFSTETQYVDDTVVAIHRAELDKNLEHIRARRRKYESAS